MIKILDKKEIIFLIVAAIWIFSICIKGLNQPLYWDSAYSLASQAKRIATNLNFFNYQKYNLTTVEPVYTSFINEESDYPHTFGLALFYGFFLSLFPNNYFLVWHLLSLLFSIALVIFLYLITRSISSKIQAVILTVLMISNPLFLAQTTLVYHEIPATIFKYLAIYFLIKDKNHLFLIFSIIAFLIRFENGPILVVIAACWFGFIKQWRISWQELRKGSLYISALILAVVSWFLVHRIMTGWFLINPLFGHVVDHKQAIIDMYSFLFIEQGRWVSSLIIVFLLVFNYKKFIENKKIIVLIVLLSIPLFLIAWHLGTTLPRYIFSILPGYYLLLTIGLPTSTNNKTNQFFIILMITLISSYQVNFLYKCSANFETCLSFTKLISMKKEVGAYLDQEINEDAAIYVNWDEEQEFSDPNFSLNYFCKKCKSAKFDPSLPQQLDPSITNYILISPNSTKEMRDFVKHHKVRLIKKVQEENLEIKPYLIKSI